MVEDVGGVEGDHRVGAALHHQSLQLREGGHAEALDADYVGGAGAVAGKADEFVLRIAPAGS